jgi:hypothetical protein
LAIIPSVVSMPPNIITAAFETTSAEVSCAAEPSSGSTVSRNDSNAAAPVSLGCLPSATPVTDATIASYHPSIVEVSAASSPSSCATTRAASGPARLRRSSARPSASKPSISASTSASTSGANRSRTAASLNGSAKGSRCRVCSAPSRVSMLGPTTCPVEKRWSSTVNVSASRIA